MLSKKTAGQILFSTIMVIVVAVTFSLHFPGVMSFEGTATAGEQIRLTWTDDPRTTQTITWTTEVGQRAGQVQYVLAADAKAFPFNAKNFLAGVEQLSTNMGLVDVHSVTLTGLKPGTPYIYRVGDETSWSELRRFVTAPAFNSAFKFLVFGDSQSSNYDIWHRTIQQAYQTNPDAVFFTNVGDLVDVGQDYAQWRGWFTAAQGVVDRIPVMPVTGNHENYTPERQFSMPVLFTAQIKLPHNGPEGLMGQVYSFDYGDTHFAMLDSQEGEERRFAPIMLAEQQAWLEKDLAATHKKWKIVVLHRPLYNNKEQNDNENIRKAFVPILDKYHIDVVFTGHDHVYARTYPMYGGAVVDNPGKGTIYVATGRSGTKTYQDQFAKGWNEFFYNPLDEPNYLTVEMQKDSMMVKAFTQSGLLIDSWTINK